VRETQGPASICNCSTCVVCGGDTGVGEARQLVTATCVYYRHAKGRPRGPTAQKSLSLMENVWTEQQGRAVMRTAGEPKSAAVCRPHSACAAADLSCTRACGRYAARGHAAVVSMVDTVASKVSSKDACAARGTASAPPRMPSDRSSCCTCGLEVGA
jgi:hypothetical protein